MQYKFNKKLTGYKWKANLKEYVEKVLKPIDIYFISNF